jgi:hypothetical protein
VFTARHDVSIYLYLKKNIKQPSWFSSDPACFRWENDFFAGSKAKGFVVSETLFLLVNILDER